MKIIVPMAGRGSRLRPHTLTVPKPLIPIAGKPIVHRLVEDIAQVINQKIDEIAFIIHKDFGKKVEEDLVAIAEKLGARGTICYQNEALGTAHAILCAKESMTGPLVVAYADTLFRADFSLDTSADAVIWVKQVDDPSAFGVVQLNDQNQIVDFVEKPKEFVSNKINAGLYIFSKKILDRIELRNMSIEKEVFPFMASDSQLYAFELKGFWMDVGQPKDYLTGMCLYLDSLKRKDSTKLYSDASCVGNVLIVS